jgi:hypothetical protein
VVTELFYLQTHQLENFLEEYEDGGRPQGSPTRYQPKPGRETGGWMIRRGEGGWVGKGGFSPRKDGKPEERKNGVNYTKRAILQVMKEALYAESSRFTF